MNRRFLLSTLVLVCLGGQAAAQDVQIVAGKDAIDFKIGDEVAGRYLFAPTLAKPILWPLRAPGGVIVTRAWPMEDAPPGGSKDHPHQKSAWFCHGDVVPEGIELKQRVKGVKGVDFWAESKGHGKMVCTKVAEPKVAGFKGGVVTTNEWRTADGIKIMDETRHIQFCNFGKARLFVFNIDLHASVCPITFDDTKEGAMGIRIRDEITAGKAGKGTIQNAEGKKGESQCWGQKSVWCDYSGPIDGKVVGLAIFDDPQNPHPACWHVRGYGLMAANPFGREVARFPATKGRKDLVRLSQGEHLRLRYGILLHEGDVDTGRVAGYFERFVKLREN